MIYPIVITAGLAISWSGATTAAPAEVDLALVLAADVSSSMDANDLALQRRGYVAALRDAAVIDALASGPLGRVAVTYVEWGGAGHQSVVVPWTVLDGGASVEALAARLAAAPVTARGGHTSISEGLRFAAAQFAYSGVHPLRRIIDVSGDGVNDEGPSLSDVRREIVADGITINGLSIGMPAVAGAYVADMRFAPERLDLRIYYEAAVIGGPGAFVVNAGDMGGFAAAMRRKLVAEIAGLPPAPEVEGGLIRAHFGSRVRGATLNVFGRRSEWSALGKGQRK